MGKLNWRKSAYGVFLLYASSAIVGCQSKRNRRR